MPELPRFESHSVPARICLGIAAFSTAMLVFITLWAIIPEKYEFASPGLDFSNGLALW
ncbi:hypothetical protein SAMN05216337_11016 [Bradyrhizobium brasilense]|uniref:Uncharacterized protein n=1 Tax=Bradyrhizobium brasilense TaxID=1419277 RepID=A0A1G7QNU9_9BRAD|nr:hypothetical protein SAMN05216337_11016 [Bradyrhizobium brasilense]